MYIYLIGFLCSIVFFYISTKIKNNKLLYFLSVIIALFIPCLIAGLRSENVGTDVKVYVKPLFDCAIRASSIKEYFSIGWSIIWRIKNVSEFEYGFSSFIYIIAKIFKSIQFVLFFIQMITVLPIYLGLKKFKKIDDKIWLGMLIYYFIFYSFTLNAMRQMIGISIVFYAFCVLINERGKDLKVIFMIIIAMLFHRSSALAFLLYFIYRIYFYQDRSNLKIIIGNNKFSFMKLSLFLFVVFMFIIIFNSKYLLTFLGVLGFDTYSNYISGEIVFSINQLLLRIPLLYLFITQFKNMEKIDNKYLFFLIVFIMDIIFANLSSASIYASRIGVIFNFFSIISLVILSTVSKSKKTNILNSLIVILYSITYWAYIYVYLGSCHVIPYTFYWQ